MINLYFLIEEINEVYPVMLYISGKHGIVGLVNQLHEGIFIRVFSRQVLYFEAMFISPDIFFIGFIHLLYKYLFNLW